MNKKKWYQAQNTCPECNYKNVSEEEIIKKTSDDPWFNNNDKETNENVDNNEKSIFNTLKTIVKLMLLAFFGEFLVVVTFLLSKNQNILLKMGLFIACGFSVKFILRTIVRITKALQKKNKSGIYSDGYDETQTLEYKLREYSGLSKIKFNTFSFIFTLLSFLWLFLALVGIPVDFFPIQFVFGIFVIFYPIIPISILVGYNKGWSKDVEFSFINKASILIEIIGAWGFVIAVPMLIRSVFIVAETRNSGGNISFLDGFHYGYFFATAGVSLCYILAARLIQVFLKIEENTRLSTDSSEQKQKEMVEETTKDRNDNYEELEKLFSLKEKGIITDEEFEKKKTELLGL